MSLRAEMMPLSAPHSELPSRGLELAVGAAAAALHRTSFARPRARRGARETLPSRGHRPCRPRITEHLRAGTPLLSSSISVARLRCLLRGLFDVTTRGHDAASAPHSELSSRGPELAAPPLTKLPWRGPIAAAPHSELPSRGPDPTAAAPASSARPECRMGRRGGCRSKRTHPLLLTGLR